MRLGALDLAFLGKFCALHPHEMKLPLIPWVLMLMVVSASELRLRSGTVQMTNTARRLGVADDVLQDRVTSNVIEPFLIMKSPFLSHANIETIKFNIPDALLYFIPPNGAILYSSEQKISQIFGIGVIDGFEPLTASHKYVNAPYGGNSVLLTLSTNTSAACHRILTDFALNLNPSIHGECIHVSKLLLDPLPHGTSFQDIASVSEVIWVQETLPVTSSSKYARGIVNTASEMDPFTVNLGGSGEIVSLIDGGFDSSHCMFAMENKTVYLNTHDSQVNSARNDHGTHVAGIIAGSHEDPTHPIYAYRGIAPDAQLAISSRCFDNTCTALQLTPGVLVPMLSDHYFVGARISAAPWSSQGRYTDIAHDIDAFMYENPDFLSVVSAGNFGCDDFGMTSPGDSKNALTVGMSRGHVATSVMQCCNHDSVLIAHTDQCCDEYMQIVSHYAAYHGDAMSSVSSYHSSSESYLKPDVVAPGDVISAFSDGLANTRQCVASIRLDHDPMAALTYKSGSSMSVGIAAGAAALVRQHLRTMGVTPTASLIKALLVNSANPLLSDVRTNCGGSIATRRPSASEGFGRINLKNVIVIDEVTSPIVQPQYLKSDIDLEEGNDFRHTITVEAGTNLTLSVTIAWTDPPVTPISSRALVNDIDLRVSQPGRGSAGGTVLGNHMFLDGIDTYNTVEKVVISPALPGDHVIVVEGKHIPFESQTVSLVATVFGDEGYNEPMSDDVRSTLIAPEVPVNPPTHLYSFTHLLIVGIFAFIWFLLFVSLEWLVFKCKKRVNNLHEGEDSMEMNIMSLSSLASRQLSHRIVNSHLGIYSECVNLKYYLGLTHLVLVGIVASLIAPLFLYSHEDVTMFPTL